MKADWLALDNTWEIIGLIAVVVVIRYLLTAIPPLRRIRAAGLEFADSALIAVLLVFCLIRPFFIQAFFIPSTSMEPTLLKHDRILVNKLVYRLRNPEPGDIVVFKAPPAASEEEKDFIKRCVGVEGQRVEIREYQLYRDGKLINEPYARKPDDEEWHLPNYQPIPPGMMLVFGDNRANSNDARKWMRQTPQGTLEPAPFLPRENVLGKAMLIFWPPSRVRLLH